MADPLFIYAGPSWANTSFPQNAHSTNLVSEWNLPCIDVSQCGSSTFNQLYKIKTQLREKPLPVIWVYNDPLTVLELLTQKSTADFVQNANWREIYSDINQTCLQSINDLNIPVLLIGGHCDIFNCDYPNITVGHHSWQKWLAKESGMSVIDDVIKVQPADGGNYDLSHCWGAEILQRFLHFNQDVKAHSSLVDSIWDIYFFWEELQRRDLFFEVHPNHTANVKFAKFLQPTVDLFLEKYHGQAPDPCQSAHTSRV